jgi:hypothetical protein
VAPQPLWFSDTVANVRKLQELPFHLLHSGRTEELKQEVLGKDGRPHPASVGWGAKGGQQLLGSSYSQARQRG